MERDAVAGELSFAANAGGLTSLTSLGLTPTLSRKREREHPIGNAESVRGHEGPEATEARPQNDRGIPRICSPT
ncbi:hypothetical protein CNECB9_2320059 [Cupriavidus necator]|uniref:Uncharacterized protein n=1 Tax=Cupriavidus necator TaxID=106590 RepID=A0A1K0IDA4_CUPNE|nr:hypothetical protein CNECB9_2320059 [Cupriavidus necator]